MNLRMRTLSWTVCLLVAACGGGEGQAPEDTDNPFLQDQQNLGKQDTLYLNPDGIEVEVDLEAEIEGPPYQLPRGPATQGQFALTYLRKRGHFYLESLAEDASSRDRVEWLVDGEWVPAGEAASLPAEKLRHWRIRGVNAVLLHKASQGVTVGSVFKAPVPLKPFSIMADAGDTCADPDDHIGLSQSVYWYQWNPDKPSCKVPLQDLTVTVSRMFPSGPVTYPEYDLLAADGRITVVILFGQIGDDPLTDSDIGMQGFRRMARWLQDAGFTEVTPAPVGRRFTKTVGDIVFEYDLYSPYDFAGLGDFAHFPNFQKALLEHEIVVYDGHSMLGASDFWARPEYPDFYQIFLYGGCLGYEYYVRPILDGKGGWDKVDIVSSVIEVSVSATEFAGPFLAKLMWAAEHGWSVSWKDMLAAIRKRVGDSTFGVSGVRDNCFTPAGSRCTGGEVTTGETVRHEDTTPVTIPDGKETGIVRALDVPDDFMAASVSLELSIAHTWVGDLRITLEHDGIEAVVWDRAGGSSHNIRDTFVLDAFAGKGVKGRWTLFIVDGMPEDQGILERWALVLEKPASVPIPATP